MPHELHSHQLARGRLTTYLKVSGDVIALDVDLECRRTAATLSLVELVMQDQGTRRIARTRSYLSIGDEERRRTPNVRLGLAHAAHDVHEPSEHKWPITMGPSRRDCPRVGAYDQLAFDQIAELRR